MYNANESNTFGTSFLINRKYQEAITNFKAVDERICFLKIRGKFNNFTIKSVHAPMEENDQLVYGKCNQMYQRIPAHDTKLYWAIVMQSRKRLIF